MTQFAATLARAWDRHQLVSLLLELTYRCNHRCTFCYNDTSRRGALMEPADWERLLRDAATMGVMNVTLSGGEPMVHPAFFELGRLARTLGFVVRVKTNGYTLDAATCARLRDEVDPFLLEVSLHGAVAATHDRQTQVPGSFDTVVANLAAAKNAGLRVRLKTPLTRLNEAEVAPLFDLADALGFPIQFDPEVTTRDDGDRAPLALSASPEGLQALFREQARRARNHASAIDGPRPPPPESRHYCGAASSGVLIDPFGDVLACVQWRKAIGNVRTQRLPEIWSTSPQAAEIRDTTVEVRDAVRRQGSDAHLLNFCPGRAEASTGNPSAQYSSAVARREALRVVLAESPPKDPTPQ